MRELSLHILDIVQNSLTAQATLIKISITENYSDDKFIIMIEDNGKGMNEEEIRKVLDPFFTTRTTRKVGLGLSMLQANAQACNGDLHISSKVGCGTKVTAYFQLSHIDRAPLGDIVSTLITLITGFTQVDFVYSHRKNDENVVLDTQEIKAVLGKVPINNPEIYTWLKEYITEMEKKVSR